MAIRRTENHGFGSRLPAKLTGLLSLAAVLSQQAAFAQGAPNLADALRSATYSTFTGDVNSDGQIDLLVKAKVRIAFISLDDLAIPIPLKPSSPTFVLLSSGSSYILTASPASSLVSHGAWQPAAYDLVYGDFIGSGTSGMLIRARSAGLASFTISTQASSGAPLLIQALTSQTINVDLGAANVTTELSDQNNDGRADLVVRSSGAVVEVLLADANGIFRASDANSVQAAWFGMLASLTDGNSAAALEYIAPGMRMMYEAAFTTMGSAMTNVKATLSNFAQVHIGGGTATFAVNQTTGGAVRMHLVEFVQVNGRWMLSSF